LSAWIVQNGHIDVLVNAMANYGVVPPDLGVEGYRNLGQKLWHENHLSVNHRYREQTRTPRYRLHTTEADLDPVAVLKAIACYNYQSCEHNGWDDSEAHTLTDALRAAILKRHPELGETVQCWHGPGPRYSALPEYEKAPWGFDVLDQSVKDPIPA
jgi:hypothetical protein